MIILKLLSRYESMVCLGWQRICQHSRQSIRWTNKPYYWMYRAIKMDPDGQASNEIPIDNDISLFFYERSLITSG